MWYQLLSMDACNATDAPRNVGGKTCPAGGSLVMWQSPALRGEKAKWELVGPVWTDNTTVLKDGFLSHEFVTIDFLGSMDGDLSKQIKVFLNNVGGNGGGDGCCSGTTSYTILKQPAGPGTPFEKYGPGQQMVDWGSFTLKDPEAVLEDFASSLDLLTGTASRGLSMARTLGSEEADQVAKPGRRVLIGWTGPAPDSVYNGSSLGSAQSLPRDLSLDPSTSRLMQRFSPELESLRNWESHQRGGTNMTCGAGLVNEVVATFPAECGIARNAASKYASCGLMVLGDGEVLDETSSVTISIDAARSLILVNATTLGNPDVRAGPLPAATDGPVAYTFHVVVDHSIVEIIVNNDTAFVVYAAPRSAGTQGSVRVFGDDRYDYGSLMMEVWRLNNANAN